ncbi:hypothetical protein [Bacteroides sp.]|uniref:hypothetical protein n=1 Tax=Bacteroides sp. TaxID=29523 RepID=UPI0025BB3A1F|nr:hypothetical protein [Bacteroides sp.]
MRNLFLLLAILCNCYVYSQLPVIPVPQVGSLGTYGTDMNTQPRSVQSNPFVNSHQASPYDPNEVIRQRQRTRQEIDYAITQMREIEEKQNTALYLIHKGFPSWANEPGTEYFRNAYKELNRMLCDSTPLNLERAVFFVENAYLGNKLNMDDFQKNIREKVNYCKWRIKQLNLNPKDGLAKNMAIFSLLTDTLDIKQPGTEKTITSYPLKYNLDDYDSQKSFTSHFVATLLSTNVGQCYSMPLLYLIMAERLGAKAYLSLAPHHSFIKIQDDNGAWYNLELTCRSVLSDYHYINNSYIKSASIRSKLYMSPLSKKETIALIMNQLGRYYLMKYGYDPFILECTHKAKQYAPNDIESIILEADYETRLTLEIAHLLNAHNPDILKNISPDAYKHYERMQELYKEIDSSGYEDMPVEIYERWLKHVAREKEKEQKNSQPTIRKMIK